TPHCGMGRQLHGKSRFQRVIPRAIALQRERVVWILIAFRAREAKVIKIGVIDAKEPIGGRVVSLSSNVPNFEAIYLYRIEIDIFYHRFIYGDSFQTKRKKDHVWVVANRIATTLCRKSWQPITE
ncbi:hypothetical protein, partial [Rhodopirellula bahusiensis]|uniref:hypothetical protein n=1 Tax=Rhodopirellula bahusiensis TaxID=2014065 RepID=UPI003265E3AB